MSRRPFFSEPLWRAIEAEQQVFSQVFAWGITGWNSATDGETRRVQGLYVSGSFFRHLACRPTSAAYSAATTTLRVRFARRGAVARLLAITFQRPSRRVGQHVVLDSRTFDVIGVTPAHFYGTEVGRSFDIAVPLCAEPIFRGEMSGIGKADTWFLDIMARLKPGWTVERAQAQLESISPGVFKATLPPSYQPETAKNYEAFKFTVEGASTGVSSLRRNYETQLWALLAATAIVVLIMCANLANLMLARATARRARDRRAAGDRRVARRIVRQMLSESLLIAGVGRDRRRRARAVAQSIRVVSRNRQRTPLRRSSA